MPISNSMEESAAWGAGYDVGQAGILQAVATAELLATKRERERIIKLLESELGQGNPDFITERDTTIERLIALIKGENNV